MNNRWIEQIFNSLQAKSGGIARRSISDVDIQKLEEVVRSKGFHLIQNGNQVIILCNDASVKVIC